MDDTTTKATLRWGDHIGITMNAPLVLNDPRYNDGYVFIISLYNNFKIGGVFEAVIRHRLEWYPQITVTHEDLYMIWEMLRIEVNTW